MPPCRYDRKRCVIRTPRVAPATCEMPMTQRKLRQTKPNLGGMECLGKGGGGARRLGRRAKCAKQTQSSLNKKRGKCLSAKRLGAIRRQGGPEKQSQFATGSLKFEVSGFKRNRPNSAWRFHARAGRHRQAALDAATRDRGTGHEHIVRNKPNRRSASGETKSLRHRGYERSGPGRAGKNKANFWADMWQGPGGYAASAGCRCHTAARARRP